jgi:mRNA-degrading endonuclease RelE of RelBE toxin-antitoxin system
MSGLGNMTDKVNVIVLPRFERDSERLHRRYKNVYRDITPIIKDLQAGKTPGDRISGVSHMVYKVRLANTSAKRGKSGGFRALYYVKTADSIYLLTIYSKTDQNSIPPDCQSPILSQFPAFEKVNPFVIDDWHMYTGSNHCTNDDLDHPHFRPPP